MVRSDDPPVEDQTAAGGEPLGFLVATVGRQAMAAFAARLEPYGLHPRGYAVLWAAGSARAPSQRELAIALGIPASRVVTMLDALEAHGLVVRRLDESDRRTHRIGLTEHGQDLLRQVQAEGAALDAALSADLDESERAALRAGLRKVSARLATEGVPSARVW